MLQQSIRSSTAVDAKVGKRVRMQRLLIGMSQQSLGDKLGITFQQIQKYEKGTNRIGCGRISEIADILGQPVSFFFDDAARKSKPSVVDELGIIPDGIALARAFLNITDKKLRKKIVALVEAYPKQQ